MLPSLNEPIFPFWRLKTLLESLPVDPIVLLVQQIKNTVTQEISK
jgi:hypothetical protein